MTRFITLVLLLGLLLISPPSLASNLEYSGSKQALMGLNGIVTSPVDFFSGVIVGDDRLGEPRFVAPVTNRAVGLFTGIFTAAHRATFGVADLVLAVLPITHVSPDPLVVIIPGAPKISKPPAGFPGS